jgi:hypothetical protein
MLALEPALFSTSTLAPELTRNGGALLVRLPVLVTGRPTASFIRGGACGWLQSTSTSQSARSEAS